MNHIERLAVCSHGGADTQGPVLHDFSTNSNACGPCPEVVRLLAQVDASSYPEPTYQTLRQTLADWHGVRVEQVVVAASSSEFIVRITQWVALQGQGLWHSAAQKTTMNRASVYVPPLAYSDYERAARSLGLPLTPFAHEAHLQWWAEPSSPLGQNLTDAQRQMLTASGSLVNGVELQVIDCAYAPLRLEAGDGWFRQENTAFWQLLSPNKSLGLTGVRAAYALAPVHQIHVAEALRVLAASWVLGAHGVAFLHAWIRPSVQDWLQHSLTQLRLWKQNLLQVCDALAWSVQPSVSNFLLVQAPGLSALLPRLRAHGIKLRDAQSFGLNDSARLRVLTPAAHAALLQAVLKETR